MSFQEKQMGFQNDVIYLDFTEVFDRKNHHILLQKLITLDLRTGLLSFLTAYFHNRTQSVLFKGKV